MANIDARQSEGSHEREQALARVIAARLLRCNLDELRVIDVLLSRLELGRERYGYLDLSKARDWDLEEAEELLDARIYRACALLQRRDEDRERLECEAADEFAREQPVEFGLRELVAVFQTQPRPRGKR